MTLDRSISRRTVLRGLGVTMSLPWLEAMGPLQAWADQPQPAQAVPNRVAFLYVPNGINMEDWTPKSEGADFELPPILRSLAPVRDRLLVLSGLTADKARPHGDGGGDHARALAAFLTGAQPRKTDGTDIRAGISADQVAAARIGQATRLASLEIGCEPGAMAGNCDSGYSCVYSSTMSWRSATQPLPKEVNPKLIFERMFSAEPDAQRQARDQRRGSILDFVREDSKDLHGQLSGHDRRKLDEYFSAVRDVEQRIQRTGDAGAAPPADFAAPAGIPKESEQHLRLMCDLIVLAFQADVTRVVTFVLANEGSNRAYPFIEVPDGHHNLSHHGNDPAKKAKIRDINAFQRRRRHPVGSRHDRLRQRQLGRQPPQPRQPADPAGRRRLRHAPLRPSSPLSRRDSAEQPLDLAAEPPGRAGRFAGRQHRSPPRPGRLTADAAMRAVPAVATPASGGHQPKGTPFAAADDEPQGASRGFLGENTPTPHQRPARRPN